MSIIQINNLTFGYEGTQENVFEDISLNIDTNWKLGLIGRNGKGKTTLLHILLGKYEFKGNITTLVEFEYFPFSIKNKNRITIDIIEEIIPQVEEWKMIRELNLLKTDIEVLYRNFNTLSGGEQVKVLLASLCVKENQFLLIDEPTNHLDKEAKQIIEEYLKNKKGYILVSHDRKLLDSTVDHILAINNHDIQLMNGNYTTWKENKDKEDKFEIKQNEKLKNEIVKLGQAAKETQNWSNKVEASKIGDRTC